MHSDKAEFKRLIDLMGWSQTEAGRRLRKTATRIISAVVNSRAALPVPSQCQSDLATNWHSR
jgi:hypothetical protein